MSQLVQHFNPKSDRIGYHSAHPLRGLTLLPDFTVKNEVRDERWVRRRRNKFGVFIKMKGDKRVSARDVSGYFLLIEEAKYRMLYFVQMTLRGFVIHYFMLVE